MRLSVRECWILVILCLSLARPPSGWAATHLVRADGGGEYATIQAAIDGSAPGDTVALEDGLYTGVGNRDISFHGKPVVLRSVAGDPAECVIDAGGNGVEEHRGLVFESGETTASVVDGISIQGGYSVTDSSWIATGGGVLCGPGASPIIRNCLLQRNYATNGGAIYVAAGARPTLEQCRFEGNAAGEGGAIWSDTFSPPAGFTIRRCTFIGNSAMGHAGALNASGHVDVSGCRFESNQADVGGAFHVCGRGAGSFSRCTFVNNVATYGGAGST
jgi:predicted outer membrane repeat protein